MKINLSRALPLIGGVFITSFLIFSCQKNNELNSASKTYGARNSNENRVMEQTPLAIDETVTLTAPTTVNINEQFEIKAEVECGRVAIERGYIDIDPGSGVIKKYNGITCETPNLLWEALVNFQCYTTDASWTGSLSEVGTYVYRTKHNQQDAGCDGTQGGQNDPGDCSFTGNEPKQCFVIEAVAGCETSFTGEAISCGTSREAVYTFTSEDGSGYFKIQGGLTNFTGGNATVYINGVLVDFNTTSSDGWAQGTADGFTVGQRTPGSSTNRNIRVEGSLAACGELVIRILWNSTNSGGVITGDWSVKDSNGVELAPSIPGLTCP